MIPNDLTFQHERVDDIPLLLGLMQPMHLAEVLERGLGSHHLHQGISNGLLTCGWLAFILSKAALLEVEWVDFTPEPLRNLENRV
jgi:hypothetical protein